MSLLFISCTKSQRFSNKTLTKKNESNLEFGSLNYPKNDSIKLDIFWLDPTKATGFTYPIPPGDINLVKAAFKKRNSIDSLLKIRPHEIDFVSLNFSIKVDTLINFIKSIPKDGYLGATFGIKGKKNLSIHLISIDSKYSIQNFLSVSSGNDLNDTVAFQNLKSYLYNKNFAEFNPDKKFSKVIFPKKESLSFFSRADSLGMFKPNKKVYIYFIFDMYKLSGVEFPNILFSNKENIILQDLNKYDPSSFLLGNKGQNCCQ